MAPIFLNIVASDSTLWPTQPDFGSVSLAHVLARGRYELNHFVLLDMLCAMAYGVPQVVNYDTSVPAIVTDEPSVHGFPAELQIALADINNHYAHGFIAYDWQSIEQRILAWKAPVYPMLDEDSWTLVAQLAIYESWRHTVLIYLYMVGGFL